MRKKFYLSVSLFFCIFLSSCFAANNSETSYSDDINPTLSKKASESLDYIFSTDSVGITKISIRRSEWNKMLSYFDYFYKNENNVIAESYEYSKDGKTWNLNQVGIRLRGNTSRFRPQGKDYPKDQQGNVKKNADWSGPYYEYAANCSDDDYRQSHFKIDFEPNENDKRKMSDCMKGVGLKRADGVFSREMFCYYMYQQYGIWTTPRASQTKVYIKFIEDVESNGEIKEDISKCKYTTVDFGVYEMFEEVNKQSLGSRMKTNNENSAANAWNNNSGDLWKCCEADLTAENSTSEKMGCEDNRILNTDKDKSQWSYVWNSYAYDLKTNKSDVKEASLRLQTFIKELNDLSAIDAQTEKGITARKTFYEKWFDVDFFIKTYAVNIILGMDDDYWGNRNNYYLYFDNGKDGSGKCYFIPFDYDNSLGNSITDDKTFLNPFNWGNGEDRPLMDRLLEVPEYKEKFTSTLLEFSSQDKDSPWNKEKNFALWRKWHSQVKDYANKSDIRGWPNIGATGLYDDGGWKAKKHYLTIERDNYYDQITKNLRYWLTDEGERIKFDTNEGAINGKAGVVTVRYNGFDSKLSAIVENPVREGYEFIGWTKTKNGNDYAMNYNEEKDLTLYASWLKVSKYSGLSIVDMKDSSYEGIKIAIVNLPENNYRRIFYINGKEVGGDSLDMPDKYGKIWAYPFTEAGKTYEIMVSYYDKNYQFLGNSNKLKIKAKSGAGEFKVLNKPEFEIKNNKLTWKKVPEIQIGNSGKPKKDGGWNEFYQLEIQSSNPNWVYQSWNYLGGSTGEGFNFKEHVNKEVLEGKQKDLCFQIRYVYNASPFGNLYLIVVDYDVNKKFNIE